MLFQLNTHSINLAKEDKKMKKISTIFTFSLFFALGMMFFSFAASAYIDPSAMTYIVQIVVGIVIAGGAAFAFYFKRIKRKLTKKSGSAIDDYDTKDDYTYDDDDDEFDDSNIDMDEYDFEESKDKKDSKKSDKTVV